MKDDSFEHMDVWKKAHQVVLEIYSRTKALPIDERFGLTSQMRRAVCARAPVLSRLRQMILLMASTLKCKRLWG